MPLEAVLLICTVLVCATGTLITERDHLLLSHFATPNKCQGSHTKPATRKPYGIFRYHIQVILILG